MTSNHLQHSPNVTANTAHGLGRNKGPFCTTKTAEENVRRPYWGWILQSPHQCMNNHKAEPIIHPVSKGRSHTILKSMEEKQCGWNQENSCAWKPWADNWKCVKVNSYREDAKLLCLGVLQLVERKKCLCEGMNSKIVGRVCVWVRIDSPATPLPKIITASTTSSLS